MVWTTSPEENEPKREESDEANHFQRGKPEFALAVVFDWESIQTHDDYDHDCNPDTDIHVVWPIIDTATRSRLARVTS
jgi:hypothetical protein